MLHKSRIVFFAMGIVFIHISVSGCAQVVVASTTTAAALVAYEKHREYTGMDMFSDTALEIRVSAKIFEKSASIFDDTTVKAVSGDVYLLGRVDSDEDQSTLYDIVRSVDGVGEIFNEVEVYAKTYANTLMDSGIELSIGKELLFDGEISSSNYDITVYDRKVYITGISKSDKELKKVTDIAKNTYGVQKVVSYVVSGRKNR